MAEEAVYRSEYLILAPLLASCVATILIIINNNKKPDIIQSVILLLLIMYPTLLYLLIGNRRFMLPAIGVPVIAYYLIRTKTLSLKKIALLFFVIVPIIISIPHLRQIESREYHGGIKGYSENILENPFKLIDSVASGPDTEMLPVLAAEIKTLNKSSNYYYGKASLGDLIIAPIPTAIFPDKPMTARNELLIEIFDEPCSAKLDGICPDFSAVGTFYQDFGWFGVLTGIAFLGAITAYAWKRYQIIGPEPQIVAFLSSWYIFLPILIRAGFMPAFMWFLFYWVPVSIGIFINNNSFRFFYLKKNVLYSETNT